MTLTAADAYVAILSKLWSRLVSQIRSAHDEVTALNAAHADAAPVVIREHFREYFGASVELIEWRPPDAEVLKVQASAVMRRLRCIAEDVFASPGTTLRIQEDEGRWHDFQTAADQIRDRYRDERWDYPRFKNETFEHWASFNPGVMWADLCNRYGGGGALRAAAEQSASKLVRAFRLQREQTIIVRAGHVVLAMSLYDTKPEKWDSRPRRGVFRLRFDDQSALVEALDALGAMAAIEMGRPDLGSAIRNLWRKMRCPRSNDLAYNSRERFSVGDILALVCYSTRIDFLVRKDVAASLNAFLLNYHWDAQRPTAEAA